MGVAGSVLPKFQALPGSLPTRKGALFGKRGIVASVERGAKFFHQQLYHAQYKRWWPLPWSPPRAYCSRCRRFRTFPKTKLGHINMARRDFIQSKFHNDKLLCKCESNTETDLCQDRILQWTFGLSKVGEDLGEKMRTFILTLNPNCILNQGAVVQRELDARRINQECHLLVFHTQQPTTTGSPSFPPPWWLLSPGDGKQMQAVTHTKGGSCLPEGPALEGRRVLRSRHFKLLYSRRLDLSGKGAFRVLQYWISAFRNVKAAFCKILYHQV